MTRNKEDDITKKGKLTPKDFFFFFFSWRQNKRWWEKKMLSTFSQTSLRIQYLFSWKRERKVCQVSFSLLSVSFFSDTKSMTERRENERRRRDSLNNNSKLKKDYFYYYCCCCITNNNRYEKKKKQVYKKLEEEKEGEKNVSLSLSFSPSLLDIFSRSKSLATDSNLWRQLSVLQKTRKREGKGVRPTWDCLVSNESLRKEKVRRQDDAGDSLSLLLLLLSVSSSSPSLLKKESSSFRRRERKRKSRRGIMRNKKQQQNDERGERNRLKLQCVKKKLLHLLLMHQTHNPFFSWSSSSWSFRGKSSSYTRSFSFITSFLLFLAVLQSLDD